MMKILKNLGHVKNIQGNIEKLFIGSDIIVCTNLILE